MPMVVLMVVKYFETPQMKIRCFAIWEVKRDGEKTDERSNEYIQGGARKAIPLIGHITHFYYYKNI